MDSFTSHHITRVRPRITARSTRFVEIGPLFAVAPGVGGILPFPADANMGWGLEVTWSMLPGLALGIIDAVTIRHLVPVGTTYDIGTAAEGLDRRVAAAGLAAMDDIMVTERRYWRVPRHE
jgi:hypothetical protein